MRQSCFQAVYVAPWLLYFGLKDRMTPVTVQPLSCLHLTASPVEVPGILKPAPGILLMNSSHSAAACAFPVVDIQSFNLTGILFQGVICCRWSLACIYF